MTPVWLVLIGAFALTVALMPGWIGFLERRGIRDEISAEKLHTRATPRGGGVLFGVVWLLTAIAFYALGIVDGPELWLLLTGPTLMLFVGGVDDLFGLSPHVRLFVQLATALVVGWAFAPGSGAVRWMAIAVAAVWFVGLLNATNMLDGMNGLAAGVSCLSAIGMAVLGLTLGQMWLVAPAFALAAVALGFLPFNWHRGRVFMGDSGSLFLGSAIAVLGLGLVSTSTVSTALAVGLVAGVAVLDVTVTIVRRARAGRPLMGGDLNHMYNLAAHRFGADTTIVLFWLAEAACVAAAYAWVTLPPWRPVVIAAVVLGAGGLVLVTSPSRIARGSERQRTRPPA